MNRKGDVGVGVNQLSMVGADWERLYQLGRTRWECSKPAQSLIEFLESDRAPAAGSIAVIGCGIGHDALLFADYGFDVVGFDFAPTAIATATEMAKSRNRPARFLLYDVFNIPQSFTGTFDYVLDRAFFCTLHTHKHQDYMCLLRSLLKPQGHLIALFLTRPKKHCPPFPTSVRTIKQLFGPFFEISSLVAVEKTLLNPFGKKHLGYFQLKE